MGAGHEVSWAKKTNNTGELVALLIALRRAMRRPRHSPSEVIWVDSLYARNLTMGIWMPRGENMSLVREVRSAWRKVQSLRGRRAVRIEHVRSHTAVPGNELADQLAEMGRQLKPEDRDLGVAEAQRAMATIALAANTRGTRWPRTTANPPQQPPQHPQPHQPFIIYQTSQTPDDPIRDDG